MPGFIDSWFSSLPPSSIRRGVFVSFLCYLVGSGCDWRGERALWSAANRIDILRIHTNAFLVAADLLEANDAIDLGIDRVILADANVVADPELGAALANHDSSRSHVFSVVSLHA